MTKTRVVVGMSGGVDSAVAALLLVRQGYDVHAVFMKNWEETFEPGYCSAAEDMDDAREVCRILQIPFHQINFVEEYWERVFTYFLEEYRRGRTPNPDILCNQEIKFKAFLSYAHSLGAAYIATGHYARRLECGGVQRLLKGTDCSKDQSYFLHTLRQEQLAGALFPVGELLKRQVRQLAAQAGFSNYDKKDSTGICFIGERRFREFLNHYLPAQPGAIHTTEGKQVGTHQGLMFYTLGQRQGLGIGGQAGDSGQPWYVVAKDPLRNVLVVVQGRDHPSLYQRRLHAARLHWIAGHSPPIPFACHAKIRYRQPDQACVIETVTADRCQVAFSAPQRAMTPGQSVVFYTNDACLGGGIIDAAFD